jgi:hypothetical protein
MSSKWTVECWNCGGCGMTPGCFEDCCSGADCDPEDAENCCSPSRCGICKGKGHYVVTQLTDENYDRAIPVD